MQGKGELNKDFGLYIERDFYVQTALDSHRRLSLIGNNMAIKSANGYKTQVWYFDQKSLTIKSRSNDKSFDIKSSGRSRDMQVYTTSGKWW